MLDSDIPLCVDLDGTLIKSDTLWEMLLLLLKRHPLVLFRVPFWVLAGRAQCKREIASRVTLDWANLPYHQELLTHLREEKAKNRRLILVTGADHATAEGVARELGIFDQIIASDGVINLVSHRKSKRLVELFGARGFDYAGNSRQDIEVWNQARRALAVDGAGRLLRHCSQPPELVMSLPRHATWRDWRRQFRVHQWAKNLLLFLPLFGAHEWSHVDKVTLCLIAFAIFSLGASSVYIFNDLLDLESDRHHRTKRSRPLAAGNIPIPQAFAVGTACLLAAILGALALLPWTFFLVFAGYYATTLLYSFYVKRLELVDVMTLALLYGLRVVAGGEATQTQISHWLLAFCVFLFLSLAFMKRYTEIRGTETEQVRGRGYQASDREMIVTMGIASGYLSVLVLALYVASPEVTELYARPTMLWVICLAYLYWINRVWLHAHRGRMHDDPVVYALKDRASYAIGAVCAVILFLAHPL